ncbi:H repeat-associated protein ydcC [Waddlia chondrophila 2032/99]|uniref:Transposase n=3 Tax=Waddlia chondrophila TaxID=71667 RepID=D6YTC5_WADCW|nr:ISAs1 family transposase [Waddlia chondrophila]ADI37386.1 transposase [Waddlia chondrophila WSU 86-1044]ADI37846.1 putative transposase [Waddlia chondrophila WSU 86-1044]CCB92011.1 H repeat-associated protein ydcC [Waddlia chondrophila 2032/99]
MSKRKPRQIDYSLEELEEFQESIFQAFADVQDPRVLTGAIRHKLIDILFITLCAVLCGADKIKEVAVYAEERETWLTNVLKLENGVPHYSTFWWTFVMLDPTEFHNGFSKWISTLVRQDDNQVYAIDGKALRGTAIKGRPNSFIHTVSLWACGQQLTLGQVKVKDKSNEITAIPKLLEMIDITGATITIDAMGTQTAIAAQIIEDGGEYILALKGNQSSLHDEVSNYFIQAQQVEFEGVDHQSYHMIEEGHGRLEKRSFFVTEDIDWLPDYDRWKKLKTIILLKTERTIDSVTSTELRMYISSLPADARRIAYAIRSHWGIESCHWILDIAFREDTLRARIGHIAENLSFIRKMALILLKQEKQTKGGIELKRKKASWNPDYLLKLMNVKF